MYIRARRVITASEEEVRRLLLSTKNEEAGDGWSG